MKSNKFVDCFMLMNTALSLSGGKKLSEMGRPEIQDLQPTIVNISISVENMQFVDVKNMELQITFLLHQRWIDSRLGANIKTRRMAVTGNIWKPKVTNINGIILNIENNENSEFWRGFGAEGNVLLSEKLIMNVFCTTNFRLFPFDQQSCLLKFGSYRFPTEEVDLAWANNELEAFKNININEFELCNVTTSVSIEQRPSGNFSVLVIQFDLKRHSLHYILCTGIPSTITVLICYLLVFVKKEDFYLRYAVNMLCLIILLIIYLFTLCFQQISAYLKALDLYNIINVIFVICAMLETLIVDVWFNNTDTPYYKRKPRLLKCVIWTERSFKISYLLMYASCILIYCMSVI